MDRVSSSLTILLRIVLPTVWLVTILSLVVLLSVAVSGRAEIFSNPIIWGTLLFILGSGFAFVYFVLWRFYRVDFDNTSIYFSNYFRTFKYPLSDILSIKGIGLMPNRIYHIELKSRGTFGKHIYFLASQKLWQDYVDRHSEQMKGIFSP
ncbi:MAG: hypothetical protein ABIQ02_14595 [Saprospiraceae bacterium]